MLRVLLVYSFDLQVKTRGKRSGFLPYKKLISMLKGTYSIEPFLNEKLALGAVAIQRPNSNDTLITVVIHFGLLFY